MPLVLPQYSCLENAMDRGAWQATVHGVAGVGYDLATKPPPAAAINIYLKIISSTFCIWQNLSPLTNLCPVNWLYLSNILSTLFCVKTVSSYDCVHDMHND